MRDVLRVHTDGCVDQLQGITPNRALGVVIAGGDGHVGGRGFSNANSPRAVGHRGAGGQVAWADPVSRISFACLTNGFDHNDIRHERRRVELSAMAATCAV